MPTITDVIRKVFAALEILNETPGITITELAQRLGVSRVSATNIVEALVELGLVKKELKGMPRRAELYLTGPGSCIARCIGQK